MMNLEPNQTTRGGEEPEDEQDEVKEYKSPLWMWRKNHSSLKVNHLIIGLKEAACLALWNQIALEEWNIVASLLLPEVSLRGNLAANDLNDNSCFVYQSKDEQSAVVLCQYQVSVERGYDWTNSLFQNIQSNRVFLLDGLLSSVPHHPSLSFGSFILRKIETTALRKESSNQKETICPYLEGPTMIDGLAASVISYCEQRGMMAVLYLSLEDSICLELETLKGFEPALNEIAKTSGVKLSGSKDYSRVLSQLSSRRPNSLFL
eukprot:TRINITY_DN4921_c1_g1_i1.p1 TRINITY_DN4921_c1_g1~~TRINITY_DN4921_c1_g1_i1.p1  ORF type:complete len:262 (+),score=97.82 TRINITY_DN4921_c1_g1_i1:61-846(+)